ncbi:MAG: hypothetical protein K1X74_10060 [Pirellulales bacterium]|nr:hypothetical protein [Pirellulales bacterium]
MPLRPEDQRDDRRRRQQSPASVAPGSNGEGNSAAATTAAVRPRTGTKPPRAKATSMVTSPRVIDLVPKSFVAWGLIALGGAALISGLEGLYLASSALAGRTTDGTVAAFDLDHEGSLATWFSSFLLLVASVLALVVYTVRKQRPDDYHGRYRVWMWACLCWLVMSIDESSSLHEAFKELMFIATSQRLVGDGSIWWMIPYTLVLGGVGVRLVLDLRACRLAIATFVAAGMCFAAAVLAQLDLIVIGAQLQAIALEEGLEMSGDLLLVLTMGLAARHVILDAQGLLAPAKKAAAKSTEPEQRKLKDGRKASIHGAHSTPPEPKQGSGTPARPGAQLNRSNAAVSSSRYNEEFDEEDDGDDHRMSRAERKALRRMRRDGR